MRKCGTCTLCCKIVGVEELNKPQNTECHFCKNDQCSIYDTRPKSCRDFNCLLLLGLLPDELQPQKVNAVFAMTGDQKRVIVHVEDTKTEYFKEGDLGRYLDLLAHKTDIIVVQGDKQYILSYNSESLEQLQQIIEGNTAQ